jgi:hypothetical protein
MTDITKLKNREIFLKGEIFKAEKMGKDTKSLKDQLSTIQAALFEMGGLSIMRTNPENRLKNIFC